MSKVTRELIEDYAKGNLSPTGDAILATLEAAMRYAEATDAEGNAETMEQERIGRAARVMARDHLLSTISVGGPK